MCTIVCAIPLYMCLRDSNCDDFSSRYVKGVWIGVALQCTYGLTICDRRGFSTEEYLARNTPISAVLSLERNKTSAAVRSWILSKLRTHPCKLRVILRLRVPYYGVCLSSSRVLGRLLPGSANCMYRSSRFNNGIFSSFYTRKPFY